METPRLDIDIKKTIDKYVKYDCLSRNAKEKKRDRMDNVGHIKDLCQIGGVHSKDYVRYYYEELSKVDGGKR